MKKSRETLQDSSFNTNHRQTLIASDLLKRKSEENPMEAGFNKSHMKNQKVSDLYRKSRKTLQISGVVVEHRKTFVTLHKMSGKPLKDAGFKVKNGRTRQILMEFKFCGVMNSKTLKHSVPRDKNNQTLEHWKTSCRKTNQTLSVLSFWSSTRKKIITYITL